jgi:hypothetical protein
MRLKWNLVSVLLDIVLILTQDSCIVCIEHTISLEIILDTPGGTPVRCGSCRISLISIWVMCKIDAWFGLDIPWAQKSLWMHSTVPLGDDAQVKARFGPFGYSANLDTR